MKVQAAKRSSLFLLLFLAASTLLLLPVNAANQSAPYFTVNYVDYSYDVPPTYGTNEFTGQTVIKQDGYHVDQQSVLFKIRNQPFTTYNDSNGNVINLFFNFRYRGHYGTEWKYNPFSETGLGTVRYGSTFYRFTDEEPQIPQSASEYTEKAFTFGFLFGESKPRVGDQVDFQVQAIVGHIDYAGDGYYQFVGKASDWSSIATLTIGSNEVTVTASASPQPQNSNNTTQPTQTPTSTELLTVYPTQFAQFSNQENTAAKFDWQTIAIIVLASMVAATLIVIAFQQRRMGKLTSELTKRRT